MQPHTNQSYGGLQQMLELPLFFLGLRGVYG